MHAHGEKGKIVKKAVPASLSKVLEFKLSTIKSGSKGF
jgi:hypothetical protein